ncbi:MAG: hypothetical protein GX318_03240 [Clostridia bacterium]|nr:hypothetical protein [Clostridia bacterium]
MLNDLVDSVEKKIRPQIESIQKTSYINHEKVLTAFRDLGITDFCFQGSTGYGYGDYGREKLDALFAKIFKTESAIVRTHFVSGTHTIVKAIFGVVRPGDEIISAVGSPYDTLSDTLGLKNANSPGSLAEWGIGYKEVSLLKDNSPDLKGIHNSLSDKTKLVMIQRSRGYDERPSLCIDQIKDIITVVKEFNSKIICFVDNCYGEFVEEKEPTEVGADLIVGSLIKNPGGGLAPTGGYVAGKKDLVELAASSLTAPGLGSDLGASLTDMRILYQGLFMAPHIVSQALKGAVFTSCMYSKLGFEVSPRYSDYRTDIVQAIKMKTPETLEAFCRHLQAVSPIDSNVTPVPDFLPGYGSKVIMAAGTFVQGSTSEFSADGPIKDPYWVFLQGGLSYEYVRICITEITKRLVDDRLIVV